MQERERDYYESSQRTEQKKIKDILLEAKKDEGRESDPILCGKAFILTMMERSGRNRMQER